MLLSQLFAMAAVFFHSGIADLDAPAESTLFFQQQHSSTLDTDDEYQVLTANSTEPPTASSGALMTKAQHQGTSQILQFNNGVGGSKTSEACAVRVYEHGDFTGWSVYLGVGQHESNVFPNDAISSLRVYGSNCVVQLFGDGFYRGWSATFYPGSWNVDAMQQRGAHNDGTSAIIVSIPPTPSPTRSPTRAPTTSPTPTPTVSPSLSPTTSPTPTPTPTLSPSLSPTSFGTECPPLSTNGRCGPEYGGQYCSRIYDAEWRYCSIHSWCGDTSSHQNGQTQYDEENLPEGCYETACAWRQTGDCSPTGPREPELDKSCSEQIPTDHSGYCDCNGNGAMDEGDHGYDCDSTPNSCAEVCQASTGPSGPSGPVFSDSQGLTIIEDSLGTGGGQMRLGLPDGVEVEVTNLTEYNPFDASLNGLVAESATFAQLSVACGTSVQMTFTFIQDAVPETLDAINFTIADLDKGTHGRCGESVHVTGYTDYSLYPTEASSSINFTDGWFVGNNMGGVDDNPQLLEGMTEKQKMSAITYSFRNTSSFSVVFSTSETNVTSTDPQVIGYGGRRILFGFGAP